MIEIDQRKQGIRQRIWRLLEDRNAVPELGVSGRLASLPAWKDVRVVKAVPDRAHVPDRAQTLAEGKLVYVAVPNLAEEHPFLLLDLAALDVDLGEPADRRVAAHCHGGVSCPPWDCSTAGHGHLGPRDHWKERDDGVDHEAIGPGDPARRQGPPGLDQEGASG